MDHLSICDKNTKMLLRNLIVISSGDHNPHVHVTSSTPILDSVLTYSRYFLQVLQFPSRSRMQSMHYNSIHKMYSRLCSQDCLGIYSDSKPKIT